MWWLAYLIILVLAPWVGVLATLSNRGDLVAGALVAFLVSSIIVRGAANV